MFGNLGEVIIDRQDFNSGWKRKNNCAWNLTGCKKQINISEEQYKLKGNICSVCTSKINEKFMKSLKEEKQKRLQAKVDRLEILGNQLEDDLGEDERKQIVSEMMILSKSIKVDEANIELL